MRDKEGHYIIIKGTIHQEAITIINIYIPNIGAPKYTKQLIPLLAININTILVGDINNPFT